MCVRVCVSRKLDCYKIVRSQVFLPLLGGWRVGRSVFRKVREDWKHRLGTIWLGDDVAVCRLRKAKRVSVWSFNVVSDRSRFYWLTSHSRKGNIETTFESSVFRYKCIEIRFWNKKSWTVSNLKYILNLFDHRDTDKTHVLLIIKKKKLNVSLSMFFETIAYECVSRRRREWSTCPGRLCCLETRTARGGLSHSRSSLDLQSSRDVFGLIVTVQFDDFLRARINYRTPPTDDYRTRLWRLID